MYAITLSIIILLTTAAQSPAAGAAADSVCLEARRAVERNQIDRALTLLDSALAIDSRHAPALIARGNLRLKLGDRGRARTDFRSALFSDVDSLRALAHIGLGDVFRSMAKRNLAALAEYRLALDADPDNKLALYRAAETGFGLRQTHGYRVAGRALARLLCIDPSYRDAYRLWREEIMDQSEEELRSVGDCLRAWLATRPDSARHRLDLAWDSFRLGEARTALDRLAELDSLDSGYKRAERKLLEARCRLELDDPEAFVRCYHRALELAEAEGDFAALVREAESIFTPGESARWDSLKTAKQMAAFMRSVWNRRDPDPLDERDERLLAHYRRLHHAQHAYRMQNPHSLFQTSRDYHHLMSPVAQLYEVDPDLFFKRNRGLLLDQRGLVYVRHGPPDRYTRQVTWEDPMEIWYYGSTHFLFEKRAGLGDFVYVPSVTRGAVDINRAMATDSYRDSIPPVEPEFYTAEFLAPGGQVEIEFYQAFADSAAIGLDSLTARLGVFDTTWVELSRGSSRGVRRDGRWLAVNSAVADTGVYRFALSGDIPGRRAVARGEMELKRFEDNLLDVSGLVLGDPVADGEAAVHSRLGVPLAPRPSLAFRRGETVTVYLEVYGLDPDGRRNGARHWRQRVTVARADGDGPGFFGRIGRLFGFGGGETTRLTLTFDRDAGAGSGAAPETFSVNTGNLAAGTYHLTVDVRDNSDGRRAAAQAEFEVVE